MTPSSSTVSFFLLVVAICWIASPSSSGVSAQQCKKYVNNTGFDICTPYVTYKYYLPEGPTEWIIEALLYNAAFTATEGITLAPSACEEKLQAYTCASIFNKCDDTEEGAAPRPVCRSLCEDVLDACADFYASNPSVAPPNCTANPESSSTYTFSTGETVEVQCFKVDNTIPPPKFPFECGGPYAYNSDPYYEDVVGFPCNSKCPSVIIPPNHLTGANWVARFGFPIVTILVLIVLGMQCYRWKKWFRWPNMWITILGFAMLITLISSLFMVFAGGFEDFGCKNDAQNWAGDHPAAVAQNWVLYVGSWTVAVGYANIATNVLLSTLNPKWLRRKKKHLNCFYFVSMWIFPIIILIVMNALSYAGYCSGGTGDCFFKSDIQVGAVVNASALFLLVIPFSVAQLWAYGCLSIVIFMIYQAGGFKALKKQIRIVGFLIIFGAAFTMSLVVPYQVLIRGSDGLTEYFTCETENWIGSEFSRHYKEVDCKLSERRPFPLWLWFYGTLMKWVFALIWCFFFFGESYEIYRYGAMRLVHNSNTKVKKSSNSSSESDHKSVSPSLDSISAQ